MPRTVSVSPDLHCLRCHKDYVESENTNKSCKIYHSLDVMIEECVDGIHVHKCNGCGEKRNTDCEGNVMFEECAFKGRHTTEFSKIVRDGANPCQRGAHISCAKSRCRRRAWLSHRINHGF